jgi:hypothetical protein
MILTMAGKQWSAIRCGQVKSNGEYCFGRALENGKCRFHGGIPYNMRVISEDGKKAISIAQKSRWMRWRQDRASGVPYVGRKLGRPPVPKSD